MDRERGDIVFQSINYFVFGLYTLLSLYPLYYILIYSLSNSQLASTGIYFLPKGLTLTNYHLVLLNPGIAHAAFISGARTVIGTLLTVGGCACFGYALTKRELPYRKLLYRMMVMTMYLNAGLIPIYIVFKHIDLINNFMVYVLPPMVNGYYLILIKTYIEQIPGEIEESAMVDGANYFTIFCKVVMPISLPIIATLGVFSAVFQWNSFQDNVWFANTPSLETLQMQLFRILNNYQDFSAGVHTSDLVRIMQKAQPTPTTIRMTITMVTTLPILFVYPFLQKYLMKGIMLGAVKG